MLLVCIILIAILAFLIVLLVIYFDQVKVFFKNKFKKKKEQKQEQPVQKVNYDDFIPLKNSQEIFEKDVALEELLKENMQKQFDEPEQNFEQSGVEEQNSFENIGEKNMPKYDDFEELLKTYKKKKNKTISEKIKDLPPEVKALLIDNTLKKRDDV